MDHGVWDVVISMLSADELSASSSELLEDVCSSPMSPSRLLSFISSILSLPFPSREFSVVLSSKTRL